MGRTSAHCAAWATCWPHELENLEDDGVGHLGFLDDVAEDRLRVLRLRKLPLEDASHHFDAGERILDLVCDRRGHLAERGEAVAQPFPLFELFDAGQVLEKKRRAGQLAVRIVDLRKCVADDLVRALQP